MTVSGLIVDAMSRAAFTVLLCLTAGVQSGRAAADMASQSRFDIPPQQLPSALLKFSEQSGVTVTSPGSLVEGKSSPGVLGTFDARGALDRLLKDTSLGYDVVDRNTVLITSPGTAPRRSAPTASSQTEADSPAHRANTMEAEKRSFWARFRLANAEPSSAEGTAGTTVEAASQAGDTTPVVEEVVVTAQKRMERLQDVPVPVTVIEASGLVRSNQLQLQDYYTKVPGLSLVVSGNGSEPVIAIRGITTGGDTNPTVGIVVDEVSYGSSANTGQATPAVVDVDPGDLARVEVLRGPQGTLYGASSMGGLLKFVTLDPSTERFSGQVQAGSSAVRHGDDVGYNFRAAVNLPLGDTLAVRASGFTLRDPGYIDNAETGRRDVNERDSTGGRLSALWRPSEAFSIKLNALFQDTERLATGDVDTALGDSPQQRFLPGSGQYRRRTEAYSATVLGRVGRVELTSATGYSIDELADSVDLTEFAGGFFAGFANTFYGVDRAETIQHNDVTKLTQELRASFPIGSRVTWLVGGFYTEEETFRDNDNRAADANGDSAGTLLKTTYDTGRFEEHAVFSNLTVQLTETWDVQFGGRYSENEQAYPVVLSGPVAGVLLGSDPFVLSESTRVQDTAFTYLVTPRLKVSPDLMIYARAASGYRPGGPNLSCGLPGIPCKFKADTTQNYELGMKGNLPGYALSFDASLYYIDWKDIQIANILAGVSFYTGNVSRAKSQGVELSIEARPWNALTVSAWAAYNDAELTEAFPAGALVGRSGDRLPYSSRISGNFSVERTFSPGGVAELFVGGTVSYVGDRKGNFQATTTRETFPSYTQVDLRGGLTIDSWKLTAFVNNATDKRGVLRGGLDAVFVPTYFTYIQPRTIGFSLAKSF
jgi:iron complex outermembrane recepter protein